MNIIAPVPTTVSFSTVNLNTEAARRDNALQETVPALAGAENSAAQAGLGGEADRFKTPTQALVYERPQVQSQTPNETLHQSANHDNAKVPGSDSEDAGGSHQEQQQKTEIAELKKRDAEVRAHEQAHASLGGQHAGAPSYDYTDGPDGRRYVVDGDVSIDIAEAASPEATIRKMQQVKAAALAPAEPSGQDLRVASQASQKAIEARSEIAKQRTEDNPLELSKQPSKDGVQKGLESSAAYLADTQQNAGSTLKSVQQDNPGVLAGREQNSIKRENVLQSYYQQVSQPKSSGFLQSA